LQVNPHFPAAHVAWPLVTVGHLSPQALQFCGSVCSLTHVDPQRVSPSGQPDTHVAGPPSPDAPQTGLPASRRHATPQKPQFEEVFSWTQVFPHSV
jgi:hypothetical protein